MSDFRNTILACIAGAVAHHLVALTPAPDPWALPVALATTVTVYKALIDFDRRKK